MDPSPTEHTEGKELGEYLQENGQNGAASNLVGYICGDCGAEVKLKPQDVIQCRECGYRILYKKRSKNVVQYEAR